MDNNKPDTHFWEAVLNLSESDINRAAKNIAFIASQINKFDSNISKIAQSVQEFAIKHQKIIKEFAQLTNDPDWLDKLFKEQHSYYHKNLAKYGYYLSIANLTVGETQTLDNLFNQDDKLKIQAFLCSRLRKQNTVSRIKKSWRRNELFKKRLKYLLRGLSAHRDKDYIASIPVLIPHIEGILVDFFITNGILKDIPKRFQGNNAITILKQLTNERILYEVDKVSFGRYMDKSRFYDNIDVTDKLNRGKILHGICIDYDREDWSAQVIYMIDYLCNFTQQNWLQSDILNKL